MANNLLIQSIDTDNRITAMFSDRELPRIARHGELYVVNGVLYIYADLEGINQGKWFPLTEKKDFYRYATTEVSAVWVMPAVYHTDNIQVVIYDQDGRVYPWNHTLSVDDVNITVYLERPSAGSAYVIVNKLYSWIDDKIVVGDKNFVILPDPLNEDDVYIEIKTVHLEVLKNGITTFRSDVNFGSSVNFNGNIALNGNITIGGNISIQGTTDIVSKLTVDADIQTKSNLQVDGDSWVKGNSVIDGNLTVKGLTTTVNTETVTLADNMIILNSNEESDPTQNAGIEVERGTAENKIIIQWNETIDATNIPNNTVIDGTTTLHDDLQLDTDANIGQTLTVGGVSTFNSNMTVNANQTITGNTTINGNLQVDGNTNIDGNLTIKGGNVSIETGVLHVQDNIVTINKGSTGAPTVNTGIEVERGSEGILPLLTFDETNDKVTIPVKQLNGSFLQDEIAGKIYTLAEIDKEKSRAMVAESLLSGRVGTLETNVPLIQTDLLNKINTEKTDRTNADTALGIRITEEETRATNSEDAIRSSLNDEISDREDADTLIETNLATEISTRTSEDTLLRTSISTEKTRAETIELGLQTSLTNEINRAKAVEGTLATLTTNDKTNLVNALNEEIARAKDKEDLLNGLISTESTDRADADSAIQDALDIEEATRETNDSALQTKINTEKQDRIDGDNAVQANLTTEVTRAQGAEATIDAKFVNYLNKVQTAIQEVNSDLTLNENVVIKKNLTVQGTTVTVNATSVEVDDNKLILNSTVTTGTPTQDAALIVSRGDEGLHPIVKWYENGDASVVQISEWDTAISQFTPRRVATTNYVDAELDAVNSALDARVTTLEDDPAVANLTTALNSEVSRAQSAEGNLTQLTTTIKTNLVGALNSEVSRAQDAETTLTTNLTNEINRSVTKDGELELELDNEVSRAVAKDNELEGELDAEVIRAKAVEGTLANLTTTNKTSITNAINSLKTEVDNNATTAANALSVMFVKTGSDIVFKGNLIPETDSTLSIGSADKKISELYVSANTIYLGDNTVLNETGLQLNGTLVVNSLNVGGNIIADNLYDNTTVDNKISHISSSLGTLINTVDVSHQTLANKVANETLSTTATGTQSILSNISFNGTVVIQQDLVVTGTQTIIDVVRYEVDHNQITMNDGMGTNVPYLNAKIAVNRGIEGILPILTWNELGTNSYVTIPYFNSSNQIVQDKVVTENKLSDVIASALSDVTTSVDAEVTRATAAETTLDTKLTTEINRAKGVEGLLSSLSVKLQDGEGLLPTSLVVAINRTINKTSSVETNLNTRIDTEATRTTELFGGLNTSLSGEITRAQNREGIIEASVASEKSRAEAAEGLLTTAINNEKTRAQTKENALTLSVSNEVSRATTVELSLQDQIDIINNSMSTDAERLAAVEALTTSLNTINSQLTGSITSLSNSTTANINTEKTRAQGVESTITTNLTTEIARAKAVEGQLIALNTVSQVNLVSAINEVHSDVDALSALVGTYQDFLEAFAV